MANTQQDCKKALKGAGRAMKIPFSKDQAQFIQSVSDVDPFSDLSDDMLLKLIDDLQNHLQTFGINASGNGENEAGTKCANLLAWLARNP